MTVDTDSTSGTSAAIVVERRKSPSAITQPVRADIYQHLRPPVPPINRRAVSIARLSVEDYTCLEIEAPRQ